MPSINNTLQIRKEKTVLPCKDKAVHPRGIPTSGITMHNLSPAPLYRFMIIYICIMYIYIYIYILIHIYIYSIYHYIYIYTYTYLHVHVHLNTHDVMACKSPIMNIYIYIYNIIVNQWVYCNKHSFSTPSAFRRNYKLLPTLHDPILIKHETIDSSEQTESQSSSTPATSPCHSCRIAPRFPSSVGIP